MKSIRSLFQQTFMAAAFAEAGEHETAAAMAGLPESRRVNTAERLRRAYAAVAFAEADCPEMALEILQSSGSSRRSLEGFLQAVGLQGVPVRLAVVTV